MRVMIGKCYLDNKHGGSESILRMLPILIPNKKNKDQSINSFKRHPKKWTKADNKNMIPGDTTS